MLLFVTVYKGLNLSSDINMNVISVDNLLSEKVKKFLEDEDYASLIPQDFPIIGLHISAHPRYYYVINTDLDIEKDDESTDDDNNNLDIDTDDSDDGTNDDDPLGEDIDSGDDENGAQNSEEFTNKLRLRENMILFYNILSSNINLLSEYVPESSSEINNNVISTVSKNLLDCKESLYNIITEELESKT